MRWPCISGVQPAGPAEHRLVFVTLVVKYFVLLDAARPAVTAGRALRSQCMTPSCGKS